MKSQEFWDLVGLLGPEGVRGDVDGLRAALVFGGELVILEFDKALRTRMARLQTPTHRQQTVFDLGEPLDADPIPQSGDVAEDLALAVISMGRETYQRVRKTPALLDGRWPLADAEQLLDVIADAYEQATGNPWVHAPEPVSPPRRPDRPVKRPRQWLTLYADFEMQKTYGDMPWAWVKARKGPYRRAIESFRAQLNSLTFLAWGQSTEWPAWWWANQPPEISLECFIDFKLDSPTKSTIRTGTAKNQAVTSRFVFDLNCIDHPADTVAEIAHGHVTYAMQHVADRLEMPPPPALPNPDWRSVPKDFA